MSLAMVNFLFGLLLLAAVACSAFTYRLMLKQNKGLLGQILLFLVIGACMALVAYNGAVDGSIHCFGRNCDGTYLLEREPGAFWRMFIAWYLGAGFFLAAAAGAIRLLIFGPPRDF